MEQPEGFVTDSSKVWRLCKALYGLKQASRAWWYQCTESMKHLSRSAERRLLEMDLDNGEDDRDKRSEARL